ncbi:hypothetical protein ACSBR2_036679 [Camellia fascicularis]
MHEKVQQCNALIPAGCLMMEAWVKSHEPLIKFSCCKFRSKHVDYDNFFSLHSVSKAFGLKSSSFFRVSAMAVYKAKLIGLDGQESEFEAPDDAYILDSAENEGLELPY